MSTHDHNGRVIAREEYLQPREEPDFHEDLGDAMDYRYELEEQMASLNKQVSNLKTQIAMVEEAIEGELKELGLTGAKGSIAQISLSHKDIPIVEDMEALLPWMAEDIFNRNVFQRRLAVRTVDEMRAEGINPPGIGTLQQTKLSLRKL